jgi:hypothetical protein
MKDLWWEAFRKSVAAIVDAAYEDHRLAYVHEDEDNSELFVCKCQEAGDRHWYNAHIRDNYKEVV